MVQHPDPHDRPHVGEGHPAPTVRREPATDPGQAVLDDLSREVDQRAAALAAERKQRGLMQPLIWTMMLMVLLLGGWSFLIQEPALDPEPLDLASFRSTPEILQVDVAGTDVSAMVSFNRWMKLRPESQIRVVENASRIASAAGYHTMVFNGTDGTLLARWRRADGMEILHPKPEAVSVQLP